MALAMSSKILYCSKQQHCRRLACHSTSDGARGATVVPRRGLRRSGVCRGQSAARAARWARVPGRFNNGFTNNRTPGPLAQPRASRGGHDLAPVEAFLALNPRELHLEGPLPLTVVAAPGLLFAARYSPLPLHEREAARHGVALLGHLKEIVQAHLRTGDWVRSLQSVSDSFQVRVRVRARPEGRRSPRAPRRQRVRRSMPWPPRAPPSSVGVSVRVGCGCSRHIPIYCFYIPLYIIRIMK